MTGVAADADRAGALRARRRLAPPRAPRERGRRAGARGARRHRPQARRRDRIPVQRLRRRISWSWAAASAWRVSSGSRPPRSRRRSATPSTRQARPADRVRRARHDGGSDRRRPARVRRSSDAQRLRDADRKPRGRDAPRAARAARGRGVLCEDTRRTRVLLERHDIRGALVSYHEHNEAKRTAELLPRLVAGERMALVTDAGHARHLGSRGAPDRGGARGGRAGDGAARPVGGRDGARRERPPRRAVPVRGVPAARREGSRGVLGGALALAVAGRRVRVAATAAADAALAGGRAAGPPCGRLPRAHEAVRGGRARDGEELAARFAEPPKGEIVLVLGASERRRGRSRRCRGGRRARRRRRSATAGGGARRAPHRRAAQRALSSAPCKPR